MKQHTAKRLRYSFLFLLSAAVLLIFVIFAQSQIIFGQAEDMMGETPKEIITACENDELATLGANGLRCKSVEATRTPTTRDINITTNSCPFGIKNFNIDSSRNLSYTCVEPAVCEENQFLSAQAGPTFTCIGYDIPILKDKFCPLANKISGFDEEGVPICTPFPNPLTGISCPEGQYIKGVGKHGLYMIGQGSDSLYVLDPEATEESPATIVGESFGGVEADPVSITSHNGKLYMLGYGSNSLYVLDTEATGDPATIVGESFGDQEWGPAAITSHNGKLYMIGQSGNALYELDTEATGDPATIIGESFADDGVQEWTPTSITSHNEKLYMIGQNSASLYVLDTEASGNPATIVGESFGGVETDPGSITSHNGKLYMVGFSSDSLYELDTKATGNPATIVGTGFGFRGSRQEFTPTSITSHNGKLYMIGQSGNALYELDTEATGKSPATIVGTSFGENSPTSITSHSIATRDPICVNFED